MVVQDRRPSPEISSQLHESESFVLAILDMSQLVQVPEMIDPMSLDLGNFSKHGYIVLFSEKFFLAIMFVDDANRHRKLRRLDEKLVWFARKCDRVVRQFRLRFGVVLLVLGVRLGGGEGFGG